MTCLTARRRPPVVSATSAHSRWGHSQCLGEICQAIRTTMDVGTPTDTKETVMQGTAFAIVAAAAAPNFSLARSLRRRRAARRALERELADYATASDRDDLAALIA